MAFDVVGLGENATDVAIEVPYYPAFNSEVEFASAHWRAGGQVATALVVCQRLGLRTKYIGRVGSDAMGEFQLASLRAEGMDLSDTRVVPDCPNQAAYIVIEESSGERTILWRRDPRLAIAPAELRPEMVAGARLVHVDGYGAAATQLARFARAVGIPVTADLDSLVPGIEELMDQVDYLIGSEGFPAAYTGKSDLFEALAEIRGRHPRFKLVAATLGRDGVLALERDRFLHRTAYQVRCRDTTGAGDVFHGAFAYALLEGWPMERVLDFSNAMAALNCQELGARGGIATREHAEHLMAEGAHRPPRWASLPAAVPPGSTP